jgi:hypothetical protein
MEKHCHDKKLSKLDSLLMSRLKCLKFNKYMSSALQGNGNTAEEGYILAGSIQKCPERRMLLLRNRMTWSLELFSTEVIMNPTYGEIKKYCVILVTFHFYFPVPTNYGFAFQYWERGI